MRKPMRTTDAPEDPSTDFERQLTKLKRRRKFLMRLFDGLTAVLMIRSPSGKRARKSLSVVCTHGIEQRDATRSRDASGPFEG